jgi:hypothetical protein
VKVESMGPWDTEIFTFRSSTSHRYGRGDGDTFVNTVEGNVSVAGS